MPGCSRLSRNRTAAFNKLCGMHRPIFSIGEGCHYWTKKVSSLPPLTIRRTAPYLTGFDPKDYSPSLARTSGAPPQTD